MPTLEQVQGLLWLERERPPIPRFEQQVTWLPIDGSTGSCSLLKVQDEKSTLPVMTVLVGSQDHPSTLGWPSFSMEREGNVFVGDLGDTELSRCVINVGKWKLAIWSDAVLPSLWSFSSASSSDVEEVGLALVDHAEWVGRASMEPPTGSGSYRGQI